MLFHANAHTPKAVTYHEPTAMIKLNIGDVAQIDEVMRNNGDVAQIDEVMRNNGEQARGPAVQPHFLLLCGGFSHE